MLESRTFIRVIGFIFSLSPCPRQFPYEVRFTFYCQLPTSKTASQIEWQGKVE